MGLDAGVETPRDREAAPLADSSGPDYEQYRIVPGLGSDRPFPCPFRRCKFRDCTEDNAISHGLREHFGNDVESKLFDAWLKLHYPGHRGKIRKKHYTLLDAVLRLEEQG